MKMDEITRLKTVRGGGFIHNSTGLNGSDILKRCSFPNSFLPVFLLGVLNLSLLPKICNEHSIAKNERKEPNIIYSATYPRSGCA